MEYLWLPRIDPNTGNAFTKEFLSSDICRKILKENIPDRDAIQKAVAAATAETSAAFPKEPFRYQLFEDYILQTYDYFSIHIQDQAFE